MIHGIHHTTVSTPDIDRSLTFYCDLLGFQRRASAEWPVGTVAADRVVGLEDSAARVVMLWAGNAHLELVQYTSPIPVPRDPGAQVCDHGISHFCLDVADIDAEYERLRQAGMVFHAPPETIFGVRSTYGKDPDGNVIELQEVLDAPDLAMPPAAHELPRRL